LKSTRKRIIQDLPVEELMKLALSSDEVVVMEGLTDSAKFIYELGLRPGDDKVSAQMIYHHYKQWKGEHYQPRAYFFRDFSKYFEKKIDENGVHYLIEPKGLDLSEDEWWRMRADLRRERALRKRKKNAQKKDSTEENN
jgi:hypothetical protein